MKKIKSFFLLISLACICLTFGSCDECERDPCKCVEPVTAEFLMEEASGWTDFTIEADTILTANYMRFTALDETASSYEWTVGLDPRIFTEKEFQLSFEDTGRVRVQLIVEKTRNSECFTATELKDTMVKYMQVWDVFDAPIHGKYEGVLKVEGKEPIQKEIRIHDSSYSTFTLSNLIDDENGNCDELNNTGRFYKAVRYAKEVSCNDEMIVYLSDDHKTISMEFGIKNFAEQRYVPSSFTGTRKK